MELTLTDLYKGKSTTIKNKNYFSTENYIKPFVDSMSSFTDNFKIKAILPPQITTDAGTADVTYNKVWIQAILPDEYAIDEHNEVISLIYALDVRKPLAKVYRGYLNSACLNLTVFNPKWITVQELQPETAIKFSIKELMEMESDFEKTLIMLKSTFLDRSTIVDKLGFWVDTCLKNQETNKVHSVKLSPDIAIEAYKNVFLDKSSEQFIPMDKGVSYFDMYNAFTRIITEDSKDIINKFEKTILINKLFCI